MPALLVPPERLLEPPTLRTGFGDLDALRLLRPGRLLLLEDAPERMLYDLVAQAALSRGALVLEASNRFDAYRLVESAQRRGLPVDRVLEGLRIARAFTPYQLTALLEDTLAREAQGAALVLVCGTSQQFFDEDTPRRVSAILQRRAFRRLQKDAHAMHAPLLVAERADGTLREPESHADEIARFAKHARDAWRVRLDRAGVSLVVRPDDLAQSTLAAWGA
jgi:hypothetical protein